MEDEIFDLVTDLLRYDLSKQDCIDALLLLCNSSPQLKNKKRINFKDWAMNKGYTRISDTMFANTKGLTHNDLLYREYKKKFK